MRSNASRWFQVSLFAVVTTAVASGLGCGSGDGSTTGNSSLVGTWTGTEVAGDGSAWTFVFTATTMDVSNGGTEAYKGTYTVDDQSDPKRLTGVITSCPYTPYIGKTSNGIYEIDGNTLTFAGNEPGNSAVPTSFVPAGNTRVFTLTKQ